MQNVKVFIRHGQHTSTWKLVVAELKERGIKVETKFKPCDVGLVLSGTYTNPSLFKKSYLFFNKREWSGLWETMFSPVLQEYYTVMFDMTMFDLKQVAGLIEDTYNNEINQP